MHHTESLLYFQSDNGRHTKFLPNSKRATDRRDFGSGIEPLVTDSKVKVSTLETASETTHTHFVKDQQMMDEYQLKSSTSL